MQSRSNMLRIVSKEHSNLSKAQIKFNTLIRKIEGKRELLAKWQQAMSTCQMRYANEFFPLRQTQRDLVVELAHALDDIWSAKTLTANQRGKISQIICAMTEDLLVDSDSDDLKRLYARHSGRDFDEEMAAEDEAMVQAMGALFGIDLSELQDADSADDAMSLLEEKLRQEQARKQSSRRTHNQSTQYGGAQSEQEKKKAATTRAALTREQKEAENVSQSIREVYRKLVSALHPDKEPDPAEQDRKTGLMQRVNVAYDKKDLLQLLELQLEVEQIDQVAICTIPEKRLTYYNKILSDQLADLNAEIQAVQSSLLMPTCFGFERMDRVSPDSLFRDLDAEIKDVERHIIELRQDLESVRDVKSVKQWLKKIRTGSVFPEDDEWLW